MEVTAKARFVRMSARKVRLVADLVRGLPIAQALDTLKFMNKAASKPVEKTIRSAVANADHNAHLDKDALILAKITVDKGMVLKRWRPRAFGRAAPIHKHSCHITVVVSDEKKAKPKEVNKSVAKKKQESGSKKQGKTAKNTHTPLIPNS